MNKEKDFYEVTCAKCGWTEEMRPTCFNFDCDAPHPLLVEIANLKERLEAWRKGSFYSNGVYILQDNELQKLKDLGEI